jgi:hypothetical protein
MFMTENRIIYIKYGLNLLGIEEFMPDYDAFLAEENMALEVVRKSAETDRIASANVEFDNSFIGMRNFTKSNLKHYDPAVCYAAENMWVVFKHFGNITTQPYRQELGLSVNLLQELRARASDYATLGLSPWADAHEKAANTLAEMLSERNIEVSKQSKLRTREVRLYMDTVYQKITDRVDAKINLVGKDFAGNFYAEYNAHATEYKHKLAQHLGRIKKGESSANNEQPSAE